MVNKATLTTIALTDKASDKLTAMSELIGQSKLELASNLILLLSSLHASELAVLSNIGELKRTPIRDSDEIALIEVTLTIGVAIPDYLEGVVTRQLDGVIPYSLK